MPRVAQAPRKSLGNRTASGSLAQPPYANSPIKIPLNDDASEKARRSHGRKAMHEAQINQLRAAATPLRNRASLAASDFDPAQRTPSSGAVLHTPRPRGRGAPRVSSGLTVGISVNDLENDDDRVVVTGTAVTPMKRVPILANFEEWMKMATDNKINATNSWNFALIDYFHDMSLLKEGDGVNFQKASCTLDGCVKIYTSRVDSVATETGRLLSGLADSRDARKRGKDGEGAGEDEEDEEEVDENGNVRKKAKKKTQRSSEATLAPSFEALQFKKFDQEFNIDPLFKKASADFDEGGAKGLLLNHLMIDSRGRIVFDSSDDDVGADALTSEPCARDDDVEIDDGEETEVASTTKREQTAAPADKEAEEEEPDVEIDTAALGAKFFPDLSVLDRLDVCPSLKTFTLGETSDDALDIPFLRDPDQWRPDPPAKEGTPEVSVMLGDRLGASFNDNAGLLAFEDDNDDGGGAAFFDMDADTVGFGEGGQAWAREAALEPHMLRVYDTDAADNGAGNATRGDDDEVDNEDNLPHAGADYVVSMAPSADKMHQDILSYFDHALQKNWTSAEHWRIRKIKDATSSTPANDRPSADPTTATTRSRRDKQPFEIDFSRPLDAPLTDALYTMATSNATISMPKKDWKSKTRNLLPDDRHFSSLQLLSLFLKPRARLTNPRRTRPAGRQTTGFLGGDDNIPAGGGGADGPGAVNPGDMDEAFWATQPAPADAVAAPYSGGADNDDDDDNGLSPGGADYDANFFDDVGDGGGIDGFVGGAGGGDQDEFVNVREHLSPPAGADGAPPAGPAGVPVTAMGGPGVGPPCAMAFGSMLVTQNRRVRPEYVQYARVAKKVDVRRLKEEMWRGMGGFLTAGSVAGRESLSIPPQPQPQPPNAAEGGGDGDTDTAVKQEGDEQVPDEGDKALQFTAVMNNLQRVYPPPVMDDISTSYCFICLLHLANEKGLVIENTLDLEELLIRKDWTAVEGVGDL